MVFTRQGGRSTGLSAGAGKLTKYPHVGFALRPGALLTTGPALCSPPAGMAPGEVSHSKVHKKGNTECQRKCHSSYSMCPKIDLTSFSMMALFNFADFFSWLLFVRVRFLPERWDSVRRMYCPARILRRRLQTVSTGAVGSCAPLTRLNSCVVKQESGT